jgi:hypothetical protein
MLQNQASQLPTLVVTLGSEIFEQFDERLLSLLIGTKASTESPEYVYVAHLTRLSAYRSEFLKKPSFVAPRREPQCFEHRFNTADPSPQLVHLLRRRPLREGLH